MRNIDRTIHNLKEAWNGWDNFLKLRWRPVTRDLYTYYDLDKKKFITRYGKTTI